MRIYFTILLIAVSLFTNAQTFSWSGYHHIDDQSTFTIPINVSGLQNTIDNAFGAAHICLNITHSYDADLTISLQSPAGTTVTLLQNIGGAADNFSGTCLGMDGVSFLNGQAPYTGLYFPVGEINSFNNGQNPNGIWILTITDVASPDTGSIHNASIAFTNNPPLQPGVPGLGAPVGTYLCGTCTCPDGAPGCDLLPDMTSSVKEIQDNHTEEPGVMYVSNATPNIGSGPLDIFGIDSCFCADTHVPCNTVCPTGIQLSHVVKQRIYQKVPGKDTLSYYDRFAGSMTFHPGHNHIHVDNWANYTLRTATSNPDARTWPIIAAGTKQSFCLVNLGICSSNPGECKDNNGNNVITVPNNGLGWHTGCNLNQGIYPGYYDVYSESLNDPMPLIDVCNGTYYIVSITDPDNKFLESDLTNNWVAVPVILTEQNVSPSISALGSTTFCAGGSVVLTSTPQQNYLWSNGQTTQSITVTEAGTYSLTTICGAAVIGSNSITTTVIPANLSASVNIAITNGSNPTCTGSITLFTASPANGGTVPSYQWKVNGVNVGTNNATYWSALNDGDIVTCTLTSNITCLTNTTAVSNGITMSVTPSADPAVTIEQDGGPGPICAGAPATFNATVTDGISPAFQWKVDGANAGTNSSTFTANGLTDGQQVSCDITASVTCPATKVLGTGTTVNDDRDNAGAAYPTWYGNGRQQFLIKAAELNAFGVGGKISSVSFNIIATLGIPLTLKDYTIKIGQSSVTNLTGAFQSPAFTTVFGPVDYTPVPNSVNRHIFSTAFDWDGTSNLIIDICFASGVTGSAAYQNYQSATAYVSNTFYQADGVVTDACTRATGPNTSSMRPNMVFTISSRVPASSNTITMYVGPITDTYTFTGSGNWDVPANWANGIIPPSPLTGCRQIIVDPIAGQECILNVEQTVSSGAKITVKQNKKFRINDNLTIVQ